VPSVLISAILSSFLLVRLIKGPWLRYPQYPAVAMVGWASRRSSPPPSRWNSPTTSSPAT